MKAREILKVKGELLYYTRPDSTILDALQVMYEKDIGSLVVMEGEELVGMLTFREVIAAFAKVQGDSAVLANATVRRYMDDHPMTVTPDTDINEVRRMMLEAHCRYLPVLDAKVILGVISFYDVARAVLEFQSTENRLLKAYIRDWPAGPQEG